MIIDQGIEYYIENDKLYSRKWWRDDEFNDKDARFVDDRKLILTKEAFIKCYNTWILNKEKLNMINRNLSEEKE